MRSTRPVVKSFTGKKSKKSPNFFQKAEKPAQKVKRVPVDLDIIAKAVADGTATFEQELSFFDQVQKLIASRLVGKYEYPRTTYEDTISDVIVKNVLPNLKKYDIDVASYSSWVCRGTNLTMFRDNPRIWKALKFILLTDDMCDIQNLESIERKDDGWQVHTPLRPGGSDHTLRIEMQELIENLMKKYPKHYEFLRAFFGDVSKPDWEFRIDYSVYESAKEACANYAVCNKFYAEHVLPYLGKFLNR